MSLSLLFRLLFRGGGGGAGDLARPIEAALAAAAAGSRVEAARTRDRKLFASADVQLRALDKARSMAPVNLLTRMQRYSMSEGLSHLSELFNRNSSPASYSSMSERDPFGLLIVRDCVPCLHAACMHALPSHAPAPLTA